MADDFKYDVFLSHSSKDKAVVRAVAERLRKDGLRLWFDEWELKPGDSIPAKIEEGLEHCRVLVLCISVHVFGSDWAQLESHTFRFRDPLNKERRFIPLRLDEAPIKGSLAQFSYINWLPDDREDERHARYWMAQAFPVLLVIRNSDGEVRWMEVRDWLKHASDNGRKAVKQIVFEGERLDVMSVRRWRDRALGQGLP